MNDGEQLREMQKAFAEPLMKRIKELEQNQRKYRDAVMRGQARIAELEALLSDVAETSSSSRLRRLAKLAPDKKELSE